ncbi:MAG: hypothetical protein BGO14_02245 [Chlamydiales bacterium 38-26]|nr:hypothetical protein [Chlamydiales bacterium]OJV08261.1 MAG: hypothetical protein BGO14_02245 [Chlamydiales bacterium 38-26]
MKIIQSSLNHLDNIPATYTNACKEGKWYKFNRIFILQSDDGYSVISMNIFERLLKSIIGDKGYFSKNKFQKVRVLDPKEIKSIPEISQQSLNNLSPFSQDPQAQTLATKILIDGQVTGRPIPLTRQDIVLAAEDYISHTNPEREKVLDQIKTHIQTDEFQKRPKQFVEKIIKKGAPKTPVDAETLDFLCALIRDCDSNPNFPWNKKN